MKKVFIITVSLFALTCLQAQDRNFNRTYQSTVLPRGAIDLEFWHTSRMGHTNQFFHAQDQRMEIEFGLGKNWQTAFYFNRYQKRFSTSPDGTTTFNEMGFSNEWKVKLSDPVANRLGVALYGEWGIKGGDELDVELELDTQPREVVLPPDFKKALDKNAGAKKFFDTLSYSSKLRYVLPLDQAKTEDTRQRRIEKAIIGLNACKK